MSLKAYDPAWPANTALRAAAARWRRRGLLAPAQQVAIEAAYPLGYYRPDNNWLRLLLFLATYFAAVTAGGTVGLFVLSTLQLDLPESLYPLLIAVAATVALEFIIRRQHHYRSGVDNALLYGALGAWQLCWVIWAGSLASYEHPLARAWLTLLPSLLALALALVRYGDPVVALATFGTALVLLAETAMQSTLGKALLPFIGMAAAGALLLALRPGPRRPDFTYYHSAYVALRAAGLVVLYLAGNYLVVREGNAALLGHGGPSVEIPFAPVFWAFTFALPVLYLVLGLRRHDRLLLWLGLLALGFSVFTFRTYHSVLPPAIAATLAGALFTGLALALLRYLRPARHGLTAEADDEVRPALNLENFVQLETAHATAAPAHGFEFGGGTSAGGGAEGQF